MILLEQTDAGGSVPSASHGFNSTQSGEQYIMKVPNNKVNPVDLLLSCKTFKKKKRVYVEIGDMAQGIKAQVSKTNNYSLH